MNHKGTFFKKYLYSVITILIVNLLILYCMSTFFFNSFLENEKRVFMSKNAKLASTVILDNTYSKSTLTMYNLQKIQTILDSFAAGADVDFAITTTSGTLVIDSKNSYIKNISPDIANTTIAQGSYFEKIRLESKDNRVYYLFGMPIKSSNNDILGLVYTLMDDTTRINTFTYEINKIFLLASFIAIFLSSLTALILSKKITDPVQKIHKTANLFSQGNFSERVQDIPNDELGDLARDFNNMAESFQNFEFARRSFISNLSHELRTPMTTISGFVDGILDGTIPAEMQAHYLEIVSSETKRLSRLIKSMRNLAKVDNGNLIVKQSKFYISKIINSVLSIFQKSAKDKNIHIDVSDKSNKMVFSDYDMVFQIIYNLLENAIKFTNYSGYIKITCFETDNYIQVNIKNSGIGISPEDLPFIFDKFYKADKSRSIDTKGMGLGLYLCKVMSEINGGSITVNSEFGEFCEFQLLLKAET